MSYSLNWIALLGVEKDEGLSRLGLVDTGNVTDFPRRDPFMWTVTPQGYFVVVAREVDLLVPEVLSELSAETSLLAAWMETNDCTSEACGYAGGVRQWRVATGDGNLDLTALIVEGEPPTIFEPIRARLERDQALPENEGVRVLFEGPLELVGVISGWAPETIHGDLTFYSARAATGSPFSSEMIGERRRLHRPRRPPPLVATILFVVSLIEFAGVLLRGVDIDGASGPEAYAGVSIQIVCSTTMLWILRHGATTIAGAVALLLVFLGGFVKAQALLAGIRDDSNYLPLSVPIFLIFAAAGVYEIAKIVRGPRSD